MKRQKLSAISALLSLPLFLGACSEDGDTVVAVNITATDDVGIVSVLNVSIVQGANTQTAMLTPPLEETEITVNDAAVMVTSIQNAQWFERITLSGSWKGDDAMVSVSAVDDTGMSFTDEVTVEIVPGGAVAAFLELAVPPPPEEMDDTATDDTATDDTATDDTATDDTGG
jgi:hypothetical protein